MADYKLNYDNEASGPFVEDEIITFGGGATAQLVILRDNGTVGEMYYALISGTAPADGETITGGTSAATADVDGTPFISRFPLKIRDDLVYTSSTGNIRLDAGAPALGTTHSMDYDTEVGGPFVANEILTFGNGSTAELITLTDNGTDGTLDVRMIGLVTPPDNDTITGGTSGATAAVDGAVHTRAYTPNNIHYFYSDLGDDAAFVGNDEQDRTKPRISRRIGVTDVELLGSANIDDALSYRMYGGSISQGGGSPTEYNAVNISVVDADGETQPVIIQSFALHSDTTTEYWKNAYMPTAASKIKILVKVNVAGTVTDRRVVRFRALENLRNYFTAPDPTLSGGITPVSLVATDDGNNTTAPATVATWTTAALTYGLQNVDHNNGNGAQPYWATGDIGTQTKPEFHERQKWVQRRGTAETIYGHNAQLIVGNDLDVAYDNEALGPFIEGSTVTFGSGGTALILALQDDGTTGTLYCQRMTGDAPLDNDTITAGSVTADVNGDATERLIINNLMGGFTGTDFNPANRGITLDAADAGTNDLFTDLLGAQQSPPNNQSGTVNTAIGNTITCFPYDGVATDAVGDPEPDFNILSLNTTLSGAAETAIVATTAIESWTPQTGNVRVELNSGLRRLVPYTSWATSTFTIAATDFTGDNATAANELMPAPIDQVATATSTSFTGVYSSDQEFVIRVTNGSGATVKQPFTTTAVFGSGGFSTNVTLQDD